MATTKSKAKIWEKREKLIEKNLKEEMVLMLI